jgi:GNAT superfamily N-acetyltransferase
MTKIVIYDSDDNDMKLALAEFIENSEACQIAKISIKHLNNIFFAYIAQNDNKTVGICGLFNNQYLRSEMLLAVREGYQFNGIANLLQEKLLHDMEIKNLPLSLTTSNSPANAHVIKFYKKFGFVNLAQYKENVLFGYKTNSWIFNKKRKIIFYLFIIVRQFKKFISI